MPATRRKPKPADQALRERLVERLCGMSSFELIELKWLTSDLEQANMECEGKIKREVARRIADLLLAKK